MDYRVTLSNPEATPWVVPYATEVATHSAEVPPGGAVVILAEQVDFGSGFEEVEQHAICVRSIGFTPDPFQNISDQIQLTGYTLLGAMVCYAMYSNLHRMFR